MLVLSRKKNEGIAIQGDITVTPIEIRGLSVLLSIAAPKSIPIRRTELPPEAIPQMVDQTLGNLVLTRRQGQEVLIGDDITLSVVEIRGDKVRLGIVAPKTLAIQRTENLKPGQTL